MLVPEKPSVLPYDVDVRDQRADRLRLRRRLADVEAGVVVPGAAVFDIVPPLELKA